MIKFLVHRPIAVLMSFLALLIFSVIAITQLPISLLPDTEVPQLSISVTYPNASPQEIEQNVLKPIREGVGNLNGLEQIESKAAYETGTISLTFSFDTPMDLAYISANEKMDRLMNQLPADLQRPRIIKANTSDIPIIKIQAVPSAYTDLISLSELITNVVKKRIEQIEGVSLVDINGTKENVIAIAPNNAKLMALGLTYNDIIRTITESNQPLGAISVKDGQYRYYIKINNFIKDKTTLNSLAIGANTEKPILLSQVATISEKKARSFGSHLFNRQEGIVLNIHKQSGARMVDLVPAIKEQVKLLNNDYKQVEFITTQDQSTLLDISIDNLITSLVIGGSCAFIILFAFMSNYKIPFIIGISLPSSILLSFLLFSMLNLSINIITLSGLALGLGMLIDNAIIVIDNIARKRAEGLTTTESCIEGVEEVIAPLISSVLTTLAVFVPLIFLGGVGGTLFYDQALSVAAILSVSLLVAFVLLPVLYSLFFKGQKQQEDSKAFLAIKRNYKNQFRVLNANPLMFFIFVLLFTIGGLWLSQKLKVEGLPAMDQTQKELQINWNEPITLEENKKRTEKFLQAFSESLLYAEADIGVSQYLLQKEQADVQSAKMYLDLAELSAIKDIRSYFREQYPSAAINLKSAPNAFDQVFGSDNPYFEARFRNTSQNEAIPAKFAENTQQKITEFNFEGSGFEQQNIIKLTFDYDKLNIYNISPQALTLKLDQLFSLYKITDIKSFNEVTSVYLEPGDQDLLQKLNTISVRNREGDDYTLRHFVTPEFQTDQKFVTADLAGAYQSLVFSEGVDVPYLQSQLKNLARENNYLISFAGEYFTNKENISRLLLVLTISILLLYFILVAQFESFLQPLIIIITLPVGIAGSMFLLYFTGMTLNVMSAIGIIITLGIIVNDSILKIDTINRYRKNGLDMNDALAQAGSIRLKPILMTSITTILALLPILFFSGLGATLQTPLVYAVVGGLTFGTLVSIFLIPILYRLLIKR